MEWFKIVNLHENFTDHVGKISGFIMNMVKDIILKESIHSEQLIYRKDLLLRFKSTSKMWKHLLKKKIKKYCT